MTSWLILPGFVLINSPQVAFAKATNQYQPLKMPGTWDEITMVGKRSLNIFLKAIKEKWLEVLEIWKKIAVFFENLWDAYIFPKIEWIWHKILVIFGKEVEKKKETIPKELEKEKKEIKEEIKKGPWERFKK